MKRHFTKDNIQMSPMNLKRCLASLVFRKIKIKLTRFHHLPANTDVTENTDNRERPHGCAETRTHDWWDVRDETVRVTLENNWAFKKVCRWEYIYLPHDPAILPPICPRELKTYAYKGETKCGVYANPTLIQPSESNTYQIPIPRNSLQQQNETNWQYTLQSRLISKNLCYLKKTIHSIIPFMYNVQNRQIYGERLQAAWGWQWGGPDFRKMQTRANFLK